MDSVYRLLMRVSVRPSAVRPSALFSHLPTAGAGRLASQAPAAKLAPYLVNVLSAKFLDVCFNLCSFYLCFGVFLDLFYSCACLLLLR